jgi:Ca-activated chloride channel family protein
VSLDRFELAQPLGLLAVLAIVPIVIGWRYAAMRRRRADAAYGGAAQLRSGAATRWRRTSMVLLLAAVVLLALAMARPRWGSTSSDLERRGIDIAIAIDVSRSMLATDVAPTRAEAAAAGIQDLLTHLRGDRVALSIFAGNAFERSPLTLDLDAVSQLVERAQSDEPLVRPGSDLGLAIESALASLRVDDRATTQAILLISDGEDLRDRLEVAIETAEDLGVRIDVVPVGTADGSTLDDGQLSQADRSTLGAIASRTGGELRELDSLSGLAVEYRRLALTRFDESTQQAPVERFQWFLGAALVLLLLRSLLPEAGSHRPLRIGRMPLATREAMRSTRHGLAAGGLLAALLIAGCSGTSTFEHVEEGNEAFAFGDFDGASLSYTRAAEQDPTNAAIHYNRANTLYELFRFVDAREVYALTLPLAEEQELANRIRYGAANTDYRADALEAARDGYIEVLLDDPNDLDAAANLELVLLRLNPPDEPPPLPPEEDDDGDGGTPSESPPGDGDPADDGGSDDGASPGDSDSGDGSGGDQSPSDGPPGGDGEPQPSDGGLVPSGGFRTLEEAEAALEAALQAFGEEISIEEARILLELAAEANALRPLQGSPTRGPIDR